jgi:uncharacterized repeat protein (TIGR01451 family)
MAGRLLGRTVPPALLAGWLIVVGMSTGVAAAAPGPRVSAPVPAVATPPLRSFPKVVTAPGSPTIPEGLGRGAATQSTGPGAPDAVWQQQAGPLGEVAATLGAPIFSPVNGQSGANPPDPVGDVGPNDYVQMVNSTIAVYDKQGNLRAGFPVAISSLWSTLPAGSACGVRDDGDPIVLYDQQEDRWMVSQFTNPNSPQGPGGTFPMCIAYSQTGDPTGAYFAYQFNLPRSEDYEKYGIWPDGLYMSTFEGSTLGAYVFDRSAMLSGSPATFIDFGSIGAGSGVDGRGNRILPADWDGANPPPAGAPDPFVISFDDGFDGGNDRLQVYEAHADWTTPANSTFNLVATLNTVAFDTDLGCTVWPVDGVARQCIPQPNTTQEVDALSNRLMHRLQYRNFGDHEAMVVSQTVDADGADRAGVRWYELRHGGGNWSIYQQGTYAPIDGVFRWMPSAAMDGLGNIAVGYSVSDGVANGTFPGLRYTGRTPSDALGSLPAGERTLVTGTTSQTTSARWGDYSSLNVDPVDDCTFWYTGQFNGSFGTEIGAFRFSDCGTVAGSADLSITKSDNPDPVTAGNNLTYTLTVSNDGPSTATGVTVVDTLPSGVTFVSASPSVGSFTIVAGVVTWNVGNLAAAGSATLTIVVNVNPQTTGQLVNSATVSSQTSDTDSSNNSASETTTVNAVADLTLSKTDSPDPVLAGNDLTYSLVVGNSGPSTAVNVVVTDTLPAGTTLVSAVGGTGSTVCAEVQLGVVSCDVGSLDPGETRTIFITVHVASSVPTGTILTDTASATSPTSPTANASATTTVHAQADLWIDKQGTAPAGNPSGALVYLITVHNHPGSVPDDTPTSGTGGPSDAQNVVVTDPLPLTNKKMVVQFLSPGCTYDKPTHTVTCTTATLPFGTAVTYQIQVQVKGSAGTITNTASVTSVTPDPALGNNTDSVNNVVKGGTSK